MNKFDIELNYMQEFGDFCLDLSNKNEDKADSRLKFTDKIIELLTKFPITTKKELFRFIPKTDDDKKLCTLATYLNIQKKIRDDYESPAEQIDVFLNIYFEKNKNKNKTKFTEFLNTCSSYYLIKQQLIMYTADDKYANLTDAQISHIRKKHKFDIHHGLNEHLNRDMFSVIFVPHVAHQEFHDKFGKNSYKKSKSIIDKLNAQREISKRKQLNKSDTKKFDKHTEYINFVESYSNIKDPKTKLITMYNNYASMLNCNNSLDLFIEAIKTEFPEF